MENLICSINFYGQSKKVQLPKEYNLFIQNLMQLIQIKTESLNNIKISYLNFLNNNTNIIKNASDYDSFLNLIENKNADSIEITFSDGSNDHEEEKKDDENSYKKLYRFEKEDILLENPYDYNDIFINESMEDKNQEVNKANNDNNNNKIKNENNIKIGDDSIKNENNEKINFSFIEISKDQIEKDINNENKYVETNNKNNINNIEYKDNIYNNYIVANPFISCGQNNLIDNQIREKLDSTNFGIKCNKCGVIPIENTVYYCKKCRIFFCPKCEKKLGVIHPHSYYKIRNKEQFKEINDINNEKKEQDSSGNYSNIVTDAAKALGNTLNSFLGIFK